MEIRKLLVHIDNGCLSGILPGRGTNRNDFLRIQMVKEWTANPELYQGFITDDITSLSQEYLQDGHFTGCVGDLMVLTLANLLGMPISIFTSVTNMPLLCVMPTTVITQPIFLAYTQTGPGHYDVALPITDGVSASVIHSKKQTKCTCGIYHPL